MNAIVQAIVNVSALEVTWIKITNATQDSFIMSMDSRVTGTGPISSTMAEMILDMAGPKGVFGRLQLPKVITKSSGTDVQVRDQEIKIIDMEAFKAFVKALMLDDSLILKLENGNTTISTFLKKSPITYAKQTILRCMNGPKTPMVMTKTEVHGDGTFTNTMKTLNPSPVEMDLGTLKQDIVNSKGEKIAEQKGKVYLTRGENSHEMVGKVTGGTLDGDIRIVGTGVEEDNWNNLIIPFLNTPVEFTKEFAALFATQ